ncbi:transposable element Tcb2 transposase [Trichonephila clavipes]|nr:transposable element Tcb2 transposase [Trichonephila clavipes]
MSSSPVPLKSRRVGQRFTLNLSRAETSSRWCGGDLEPFFLETRSASRIPGQGRRRATTPNGDRYLVLTARRHRNMNATLLQQHLRSATGTTVSTQTVRNRLHGVVLEIFAKDRQHYSGDYNGIEDSQCREVEGCMLNALRLEVARGMVWKFGEGVPAQLLSSSVDPGSKLRGPSPLCGIVGHVNKASPKLR